MVVGLLCSHLSANKVHVHDTEYVCVLTTWDAAKERLRRKKQRQDAKMEEIKQQY